LKINRDISTSIPFWPPPAVKEFYCERFWETANIACWRRWSCNKRL
jgi:hypothetical protein